LKENKTRADKYITHCNPVKGILKCACGCNMQIVLSGKTKHYGCVARVHKKQVRNVEPDTRFYGINYEDLNAILWQEVKYRILRTEYQAKSNEKIDALNAEIYRFVESIEARQNEIVARENDKATIINNMALIKHPSALIALESKLNELDAEIADIEKSIKATEKELAKNQRRISDENKTQSIKELQEMTLEGKGEIFKNMLEKVVWVSEKTRRGFLIVTYKNGVEVIWLYKNVRGTRVAINLPSTFRYNPETYKVEVTLTKRNPNIKFDFGEEVIEEYTPDEMLKSFDFIGNEEYDASASVWED
jgi:site-specific DNA recombinase